MIRNHFTKQFRAIQAIISHIRWCLSGTPIQNSLEDLGALLKFLRAPNFDEMAIFRKHIINPANGKSRDRYHNLQKLLESLCLRRTRSKLGLPEPAMETIRLTFSDSEAEAYAYLGRNWRRTIDMAVSGRNNKKVNQSILQCLMKMRIFCNNGQDTSTSSTSALGFPSNPEEALSLLQTSGEAKCEYCQCDILSLGQTGGPTSGILTICHHLICGECLPQYQADLQDTLMNGKARCPCCGHEGSIAHFPGNAASDDEISRENAFFSTKVQAVVRKLEGQAPEDKR